MKCIHCGVPHHDTTVSALVVLCVLRVTTECLFYYLGGLGFALHDIGISLSIVGILNLPFSLFVFPLVSIPEGENKIS